MGAPQVVITPPLGAALAGYYQNRAATGVHDDLHAKALVFEKDGVKAAVISPGSDFHSSAHRGRGAKSS